jgi:glycosyltransferase involved in cell wall biosynthesis
VASERPLRVGICGFDLQEIRSITRTASLYLEALRDEPGLKVIDVHGCPESANVDAILDFGHHIIGRPSWPDPPVVCCMHGTVARGLDDYAARWEVLRSGDCLLVNCEADAQILAQQPRGPGVEVLPLAVDERRFHPALRRTVQLPACQVRFGFVGRLLPQRSLHRVLEALAEVREAGVNAHLVVVGSFTRYEYLDWYDGDAYACYVRNLLALSSLRGAVTFLGDVGIDTLLREIYTEVDLLVHPSTVVDENFGYAPLEAAACGTPALVTAWGGLRDTVRPWTGIVLSCWSTATGIRFDQNQLVAGMMKAADPGWAESMGNAARQRAARDYNRTLFRRRLVNILRRVVAGGPAAPPAWTHHRVAEFHRAFTPTLPAWGELWAWLRPYGEPLAEMTEANVCRLAHGTQFCGNTVTCSDPAWPFAAQAPEDVVSLVATLSQSEARVGDLLRQSDAQPEDTLRLLESLVAAGVVLCW